MEGLSWIVGDLQKVLIVGGFDVEIDDVLAKHPMLLFRVATDANEAFDSDDDTHGVIRLVRSSLRCKLLELALIAVGPTSESGLDASQLHLGEVVLRS